MSGLNWKILNLLVRMLIGRKRQQLLKEFQARSVRSYLQILQGIRISLLGLIIGMITLQVLSLGLMIMLGAGLWLTPLSLESKIWALFAIGAGLFFTPLLAILLLTSERLWYKASGAQQMVNDLLEDKVNK